MADEAYNDTVRDHFSNPRNAGTLEGAHAMGRAESGKDGDILQLYLRLDEAGERIEACRFQTFGCGAAIAAGSVTTELLIGRTLEEAASLTREDVAEALGGLPAGKLHCSVLSEEAIAAALAELGNA